MSASNRHVNRHSRDTAPYGDFSIHRDQAALFSAHPNNIFLVKLNYWMAM